MKRDERIMRFLSTKMDKHAVAWAEKKRAREGGLVVPKEIV
jgi:small subunit ribosomal protein S6